MPAKITYFAIVDEFSSKERPGGVVRRIENDEGEYDEAFTGNLDWERHRCSTPMSAGTETASSTRSARMRLIRSWTGFGGPLRGRVTRLRRSGS